MISYKQTIRKMTDVKIAIVGSRTFSDYGMMKEFIDSNCRESGIRPIGVISGGARGADLLGARYATEKGLPLTEFKPEWDKYGKSAGFRRNHDIINNCDVCFAFWDGQSRGTKHDIDLCMEQDKECFVCRF